RLTRSSGLDGDLGVLSDGRVAIHLSTGAPGAVIAAADVVLGQAEIASLQAVGMGKPVVTFAAGGTNAAVASDGLVMVNRDPVTVAAAVSRLLYDDEERTRRGTAGRGRVGPPGAIPAVIAELAP